MKTADSKGSLAINCCAVSSCIVIEAQRISVNHEAKDLRSSSFESVNLNSSQSVHDCN